MFQGTAGGTDGRVKPQAAWLLAVAVLVSAAMLGAPAPAGATFPGSEGLLAYRSFSQTRVVNPDGTGDRQLPLRVYAEGQAWSPDGRLLAYASRFVRRGIYVGNADGTHPRRLTSHRDHDPAFSPNGRRIVFDRIGAYHTGTGAVPTGTIISMRLDGTHSRTLTRHGHGFNVEPAYSPDGTRIAYVHRVNTAAATTRICLMRPDGSGKHCIAKTGNSFWNPDWAPNGKRIAFATPGGIGLIRPNGSGRKTFGFAPTPDGNGGPAGPILSGPSYSPDGRFIVESAPTSANGERSELTVFTATGNDPRSLTLANDAAVDPAWQPLP
jgi:Tol biopolymer transport system component